MKIFRHGKPENRKDIHVCDKCGCLFIPDKTDVKVKRSFKEMLNPAMFPEIDFSDESDDRIYMDYEYIECPDCHKQFTWED